MSQIDWEKSYILTKDQVATLGIEDMSVSELGDKDLPRLAVAMDNLTVADLQRWAEEMEI